MPIVTNGQYVPRGSVDFDSTPVSVRNLLDCLVAESSIKKFLEDCPTISFEQIHLFLQSAEITIENKAA